MDGMTCIEVAEALEAAANKLGSGNQPHDPFWNNTRKLLYMNSAFLAEVINLDPQLEASAWSTCIPWSVIGVGRIASVNEVRDAVVARLMHLYEEYDQDGIRALDPANPDKMDRLYQFLGADELRDALEWFASKWPTVAEQTKSGIIFNLESILGPLAGAGELKRRFFTGKYTHLTSVDHALRDRGGFMVAVGANSWGNSGRLVIVWLTQRVFLRRKQQLITEPEWLDKAPVTIVCDEVQNYLTTGSHSFEDFFNVNRATNAFAILIAQSVASIKKSIGNEQADNLLTLFQSKLFFRTSEMTTANWAIEYAGKTLRGYIFSDDFYETQTAREMAVPDIAPPAEPDDSLSWKRICPTKPQLATAGMRPVTRLDRRFFESMKGGHGQGGGDGIVQARMAAFWRQEDKEKEALGAGLAEQPKLEVSDFRRGRGYCVAIVQRADHRTMDIIDTWQAA